MSLNITHWAFNRVASKKCKVLQHLSVMTQSLFCCRRVKNLQLIGHKYNQSLYNLNNKFWAAENEACLSSSTSTDPVTVLVIGSFREADWHLMQKPVPDIGECLWTSHKTFPTRLIVTAWVTQLLTWTCSDQVPAHAQTHNGCTNRLQPCADLRRELSYPNAACTVPPSPRTAIILDVQRCGTRVLKCLPAVFGHRPAAYIAWRRTWGLYLENMKNSCVHVTLTWLQLCRLTF